MSLFFGGGKGLDGEAGCALMINSYKRITPEAEFLVFGLVHESDCPSMLAARLKLCKMKDMPHFSPISFLNLKDTGEPARIS